MSLTERIYGVFFIRDTGKPEVGLYASRPTIWGIVIFSVIIPIICSFGIIGNTVNFLVLTKKNLKESTYTYLTVLAVADLVTCILLLFSGLARGVFWSRRGWVDFDVFVHLPLGTISSNIAVLAAIGVAIDRLVIVLGPVKCSPPKFCSRPVARMVMCVSVITANAINIPFFFIYTFDSKGDVVANQFWDSRYNDLLNWMQLIVFGLIPAVLLLISNAIMIFAVRRTMKQRQLLLKCSRTREGKYLFDQSRLTITLVGIVFMFLVGEVPTHLASRRSAASILHGGNPDKIDHHKMEIFRTIATLLNAISSSANFVLYCLLNPRFLEALKTLFRSERIRGKRGALEISTVENLQTDASGSKMSSKDCPWQFDL